MRRSAVRLLALLVLVAVAGVLAVAWRAGARESRALLDVPPVGSFVEVDGRRVHYVQRGEGPDARLIHGASGNLTT
jgi:hypothetical protein